MLSRHPPPQPKLKSPKGIPSLLQRKRCRMSFETQITSRNNKTQDAEHFLYLPIVPLTSRKTLAELSRSAGKYICRISPTLPGRPGTPAALWERRHTPGPPPWSHHSSQARRPAWSTKGTAAGRRVRHLLVSSSEFHRVRTFRLE